MSGLALARAVAASAVADLIDGTERPATVLSARPGAVVVRVETEAGPRCVCLLAHGLSRLPNGVHADPADLADPPPAPAAGSVGASRIRVGDLAYAVVRRWDSRVRRIEVSAAGLAVVQRAVGAADRGVPDPPVARLAVALALAAAAAGRAAGDLSAAVHDLVGLGRGLTPGGDDVLAGACVGLRAVGRSDLVDRLAAGLTDVDDRTTTLSADLLRLARDGQACGEALQVLSALHAAARQPARRPGLTVATDRLLAVGHTSGADLATGLLLGLRAGATGPPVAHRR
jgi:hypothetical protein